MRLLTRRRRRRWIKNRYEGSKKKKDFIRESNRFFFHDSIAKVIKSTSRTMRLIFFQVSNITWERSINIRPKKTTKKTQVTMNIPHWDFELVRNGRNIQSELSFLVKPNQKNLSQVWYLHPPKHKTISINIPQLSITTKSSQFGNDRFTILKDQTSQSWQLKNYKSYMKKKEKQTPFCKQK